MTSIHTPLKPISNGPKATLVASLSAAQKPSSSAKIKPSTSELQFWCSNCSRPISFAEAGFKWCEPCRVKNREKHRNYIRGRAAREHGGSSAGVAASLLAALANQDAVAADDPMEVDENQAAVLPRKRKAELVLDDCIERPDPIVASGPRAEYQTEQVLLDALSAEVKTFQASFNRLRSQAGVPSEQASPTYINFHGSFTVVMDPSVSERHRAKRFITDLSKSVKLPVGDLVIRGSDQTAGGHTRRHRCNCNPARKSKPSPQGSSAVTFQRPTASQPAPGLTSPLGTTAVTGMPASQPQPPISTVLPANGGGGDCGVGPTGKTVGGTLKRTQSTLTSWLAAPKPKQPTHATAAASDVGLEEAESKGCGGMITVSVMLDYSHPLGRMGVKGQKITIQIEHPGM